jgi:hypothetical protein
MNLYPLFVILEVEMMQPDGDKVLWIMAVLLLLISVLIIFSNRNISFGQLFKSKEISIKVKKNRVFQPTTVLLSIENTKSQGIVIESIVLRFVHVTQQKAYKVTSVKGEKIYPLYLDGLGKHNIVIALEPFFAREPRLNRFIGLRIEANIEKKGPFKTSTLLLNRNPFAKQS